MDSAAILMAVGNQADFIRFDEVWPGVGWKGIRFLESSSSSMLEFCHFRNGLASGSGEDTKGGAIYCNSSNITIQNCLIDSCSASDGGGIYCVSSNPAISGNSIRANSAENDGGGIYCWNSSPTISSNSIDANSVEYNGGGICCWYSSPIISSNTFSSNSTYYGAGGGIYCQTNSNPTISSNTFSGNYAHWGGGGICCWYSSPTICGNTLISNSADYYGGGIFCAESSNAAISGNTLSSNSALGGWGGGIYFLSQPSAFDLNEISENTASVTGGGIYLDSVNISMNKNTIVFNNASSGGGLYSASSNAAAVNCVLWGNSPEQIAPNGPVLLASYSDIEQNWLGMGNINQDPLFVNAPQHDFRLQSGSPCIDTGDPNPIYNDPDGSRADMGCYYYGFVGVNEPEIHELPTEFALFSCYPNPFNATSTVRFQLPNASNISLEVFDISGRKLVELASGFHLPGEYRYVWDAGGRAAGMYFIRLRAGEEKRFEKLVLLK